MHFKELIDKIVGEQSQNFDFDKYLEDFVPNILLKSETLQKAYEVSDFQMDEFYRQGYEHYLADRFSESLIYFNWLTLLNPFVQKYWLGLGANRQLLGDYEKALMAYAVMATLDEDNPYPHYHAYECYEALNNEEDAKKALTMAFEKASNLPHYAALREEIRKKLKDKHVSLCK